MMVNNWNQNKKNQMARRADGRWGCKVLERSHAGKRSVRRGRTTLIRTQKNATCRPLPTGLFGNLWERIMSSSGCPTADMMMNGNKVASYCMGPNLKDYELWVYIGTPLHNPSGNTGVMVCIYLRVGLVVKVVWIHEYLNPLNAQ